MQPISANNLSLLSAAEKAVDDVAHLLRQNRRQVAAVPVNGDGDFATAIGRQIEHLIRQRLEPITAGIPVLGSDGPAGGRAYGPGWVLNPIDGRVNYALGSPLWAISLAFVLKGQAHLAIVDLPLLGERYVALAGGGSYGNDAKLSIPHATSLQGAVVGLAGPIGPAHEHIGLDVLGRLAERGAEVRLHGSVNLDLVWLAAGRLAATIMLSNPPGIASASVLIAREAGAVVYDQDGSPHGPNSGFAIASAPKLCRDMLELVDTAPGN